MKPSTRPHGRWIRWIAFGLAVAAVAAPPATQAITIPSELSHAQFGPASLPIETITIPEGWGDRQFGPASLGPESPVSLSVVSADGFDFRDAVVGAAVALAAVLLAAAALLLTRKRDHLARV
jgi:hypothetical protein